MKLRATRDGVKALRMRLRKGEIIEAEEPYDSEVQLRLLTKDLVLIEAEVKLKKAKPKPKKDELSFEKEEIENG